MLTSKLKTVNKNEGHFFSFLVLLEGDAPTTVHFLFFFSLAMGAPSLRSTNVPLPMFTTGEKKTLSLKRERSYIVSFSLFPSIPRAIIFSKKTMKRRKRKKKKNSVLLLPVSLSDPAGPDAGLLTKTAFPSFRALCPSSPSKNHESSNVGT